MSARNISHLREHLFNQLDMLCDIEKPVDIERSRQVCEVSKQIIDAARVEIQFAAVMKGSVTLPFIEDQDGLSERPYTDPLPTQSATAPAAPEKHMTPAERTQALLNSGPAADHPWRQLGGRVVTHRLKG